MGGAIGNRLSWGLSAGLLALACLTISFDLFQLPDNWLADRQLKYYAHQLKPSSDIVVIDIDDESIDKISTFAGFWPWPRSVHAELIEGVSAHQPKAVVFDILFSEADKFRPDSDRYFNEAIAEHKNIYFSLLHLTPLCD
jgi:adenylate cyclase